MSLISLLTLLGATLWLLCLPTSAIAQEAAPTTEQLRTQIGIMQDEIKSLKSELGVRDRQLQEKYIEAKKKEYDYQIGLMQHNLDTFSSQTPQTYTVMGLVVLVVVSGLALSAYQLWKSVNVAGVQLNNELEVSAKSVRVTSSIVGIVILVISIVFLYIYVHEVYQLRFANPNAPVIGEPKQ
jgi:cytochrome c-type biogenesis protein CcmH/NrfG